MGLRDILIRGENLTPDYLKPYAKYIRNGELSMLDEVIFHGSRILIPGSLRQEVLAILHTAHQGMDGMYHRAQQSFM